MSKPMADQPRHALSDREMLFWDQWCLDLRDQIIEARSRGLRVLADKRSDYVDAGFNGNAVGMMTGLTVYSVVF